MGMPSSLATGAIICVNPPEMRNTEILLRHSADCVRNCNTHSKKQKTSKMCARLEQAAFPNVADELEQAATTTQTQLR